MTLLGTLDKNKNDFLEVKWEEITLQRLAVNVIIGGLYSILNNSDFNLKKIELIRLTEIDMMSDMFKKKMITSGIFAEKWRFIDI